MKKIFMIYTDWEYRLGYRENKHDWEVGEFTYVTDKRDSLKGHRVMVYANLKLDESEEEVLKYVFKEYIMKTSFPAPDKIYKHLNSLIEDIYRIIAEGGNKTLIWPEEKWSEEKSRRGIRKNRRLLSIK